ncbi:MAG: hypothetical protein IKB07_08365 [Lachnospiraceae bacterium]|nr:hypothetical protein [Lachnospiraceae bacterium]
MGFYTGDAVADAEAYSAYQERQLLKLPICRKCKERIQEDTCFKIDGETYHDGCARKLFEVWTEDLMD